MSRLREASIAAARTGSHPLLPVERLFATERIAAGLEARRIKGARGGRLPAGTLTVSAIERALASERRSADRAIVEAYLLRYPVDHPAFAALQAAAAIAADRHDWRWREAGRRWKLWDGPAEFGEALRAHPEPSALLRDAGFVGRLADGAFVSAARGDAARPAR